MGVPEASLEPTDVGLVPRGEGWFVLNARDSRWDGGAVGAACVFEGEPRFEQLVTDQADRERESRESDESEFHELREQEQMEREEAAKQLQEEQQPEQNEP